MNNELADAIAILPVTLSNGNSYDVDLSESLERVKTEDSTIPDELLFFGKLLGALEREKILAEATYRQWRAVLIRSTLGTDPKKAEWKVKADVEANPQFTNHKQRMASAEAACAAIRVHINALLCVAGRTNATEPLQPSHEARRR